MFHQLNYIKMKEVLKYIGIGILVIGLLIGASYGFGWIGVHQTRTIVKAKQNANRIIKQDRISAPIIAT